MGIPGRLEPTGPALSAHHPMPTLRAPPHYLCRARRQDSRTSESLPNGHTPAAAQGCPNQSRRRTRLARAMARWATRAMSYPWQRV